MANMAGSGRQSVGGERSEIRFDATILDRRSATAINKTCEVSPSASMLMRRELELEVLAMKTKRAIERPLLGTPGFYSNVFLVPKSEQRWRLIIDLSRLNVHIKTPGFDDFMSTINCGI